VFTITFSKRLLTDAREVVVVQLQLLEPMIRTESVAVPDAATRADLIDLMARILMVVFHKEGGRDNERGLVPSQDQAEHLARKAIVYLRQSSDKQVRLNKESQHLQYAVAERVRALGWKQVEIINSDLGSSAGIASARREGFERVLSSVALGEVGIVGSRELSRLSRTDKDWCRLLEVCQIFGTLIADEQQVYDLSYLDDQLVLGIKGTLSVVELKVIRQRMAAGQESKARRGELFKRLPVGYARDPLGKIAFHPDQRVCEAIQLVFTKFRELWSVRQTFQWFRDHDIELPANPIQGTRLVWKIPTQSLVCDILCNPFYAGAYVWGRRPVTTLLVDGRLEKHQSAMRSAEDCGVFIRDHHVGYIDWTTYVENRRMTRRNSVNWEGDESMAAIRAGQGLLVRLLRCGHCGRKLHVRYWGGRGTRAICARAITTMAGSIASGLAVAR
jgi:DNA invertase Pin-like site-specific DNA recombinase